MSSLLEEFKEYSRINGNYEDLTLNLFLTSASKTLENSGVRLPQDLYEVNENGIELYSLHRLAILTLASHYYENRQVASQNAQNIVPFSVQHMILQLKLVNINESSEI
ncbi:head-tail connector protein [Lysinibacillus pakistanensis]|uniref:Head-tail connector protein n=1 Tax=Lysinibacillus pakistanensis TaxID=759811 RepID=A0AAX3WUI1_9BACI|nr:head-tail connector protein [Lysinibacillus pakistanensis]MDM5229630.1 head-tail connector protein [Lysinibacillus pakistanensis]WHY45252.1 head-tail connector protein [Lysinibacillus pakistanensis]WHY50261.1 head-tail connector protein [Lysinibacillus pakistanensis]